MVDLFVTDKIKKVLPKVRAFIQEEVIPLELAILSKPFTASDEVLNGLRNKVKTLGLWAPHLSEHHGGLGMNMIEFAMLSEEMGQSPLGHYVFNCQAPDIGNVELLEKYASTDLKDRFLKPLMEGKIRSCFSMTEPEFAGSNPVMMGTTAEKKGADYVINGHKWFTTAADGASFAVVMAVTNPEADRYQQASMVIVPTDTKGFNLVRNISIMGEAGDGYLSHAEIRYDDCQVPQSNLIGKEGAGFILAQERLGPGRIHHCMRWIGIAERAFDMMCDRAATRELSPGKLLGHQQTIQNWIAESRAEINASRYMVLHTAKKLDEQGTKAARQDISTIKFYVADMLMKVLDRAVQTHGALGITDDTVLAFWYRHERGARIYDGPDEVHKSSLAKHILRSYEEKKKS
jgi:alkylation response protein AidB-like acyl-CoA dehydrogenase